MQTLDLGPHLVAQLRVEIRERFVEQEQVRLADDGAADGDPLTLSTRELTRIALQEIADAEHLGGFADPLPDFDLRSPSRAQTEADVLVDRQIGVERIILKHHRDVPLARAQIVDDCAADRDRTVVRVLKTGDGSQKCALPQPDGPTSTANSPSAMVRSTPRTACTLP